MDFLTFNSTVINNAAILPSYRDEKLATSDGDIMNYFKENSFQQ